MHARKYAFAFAVLLIGLCTAVWLRGQFKAPAAATITAPTELSPGMERATFGAGCFWCTEAVFRQLKGVQSVISGYAGGSVPQPTYAQVCAGRTGHTEVAQITFDPNVITYDDLLAVFWKTHDPTQRDVQQYRSVIFYHSDAQRRLAEHYKKELTVAGAFSGPIVTDIVPFAEFYPAEDYHQNYYENHSGQPYCRMFVVPRLEKLKKVFADKMKTTSLW
jgi:peptide-methionine (S)-S-oxide reductase